MSTGGTIFFVITLLVTVGIVALPLVRRERRQAAGEARIEKQRERLLVYYERVLTNLRDLEEDHATGKMPDEDYQVEHEEWMQRGVQVLKALDTLAQHSIVDANIRDDAAVDEAIDDAIEASIAAYRSAEKSAG